MNALWILLVAAVAAHPSKSPKAVTECVAADCTIDQNCRCSSTQSPLVSDEQGPQLVALTVSESIVGTSYDAYWQPLIFPRLNPDGLPIGATFYVNHQYTDYELVNRLYNFGYEIGDHSITKDSQEYWRGATVEDLIEEFDGQRQILSKFANIPAEDIVGARTPLLQIAGDRTFDAYAQCGLTYDNSWPTLSSTDLFPYTLDYKTTQECPVSLMCVENAHQGFWVAPITNIRGNASRECNSFVTCDMNGSAQELADWILGELNHVREGNRAPLVLRLDSYWFDFTENSFDAFNRFMDAAGQLDDVFFVSVKDVIDWTRNPVPLSQYQTPFPDGRNAACNPISCSIPNAAGVNVNMRSCVPCPPRYPWKGNPMGE